MAEFEVFLSGFGSFNLTASTTSESADVVRFWQDGKVVGRFPSGAVSWILKPENGDLIVPKKPIETAIKGYPGA